MYRGAVQSLLDRPSAVTFLLIAVNVAISFVGFWALQQDRYRRHFLFIPSRAARNENWVGTFVSHFAHGDLGHLFVNMLGLYFFGPHVERELGPGPYLSVYLASGLAGTLAVFLLRRKDPRHAALGASGSISGVVFAAVVIAPTSTFFAFVPIPLPAPVFAVVYLVASTFMMNRGDHVAHEAHIGGALTGFALAGAFYDPGFTPLLDAVTHLLSRVRR